MYTPFSNYDEINFKNRRIANSQEIPKWGEDARSFLEYRSEWHKAATENHTPEAPLHVDIELSDACNLLFSPSLIASRFSLRCKMSASNLSIFSALESSLLSVIIRPICEQDILKSLALIMCGNGCGKIFYLVK